MVSDIMHISTRLVAVDICLKGYKLRIISAYAPSEGSPISTKELFYRDLEKLCKTEKERQVLIQQWGISKIRAIWKRKGSLTDAKKYRRISIGSILTKVTMNIILQQWNLGLR